MPSGTFRSAGSLSHRHTRATNILVRICFSLAILFAVNAAPAKAQELRELRQLKVNLDGALLKDLPVYAAANSFLASAPRAIQALTRGRAHLSLENQPDEYQIQENGRTLITIVPNEKSTARQAWATVTGRLGRMPLDDSPRNYKVKDRDVLMMDLETLASLFGITVDQDGSTLNLFTPEYWAERIGIDGPTRQGRTLKNLPMTPDMGISPPAETMVVWVRPSTPCYIQIYRVMQQDVIPKGILAHDHTAGAETTFESELTGYLSSWKRAAHRAARIQRKYAPMELRKGDAGRDYAQYVALLTKKDPGKADPVTEINEGRIGPAEWCVVGLRERIGTNRIYYDVYSAKRGDTLDKIAQNHGMHVDFLRTLNGLHKDDPLPLNEPLAVLALKQTPPKETARYKALPGLYEAAEGDTVASLARQCGVSEEDFRAANSSIPPGGEIDEGDLVTLIQPKTATLPPAVAPTLIQTAATYRVLPNQPAVRVYATARTVGQSSRLMGMLPPGQMVAVVARTNGPRPSAIIDAPPMRLASGVMSSRLMGAIRPEDFQRARAVTTYPPMIASPADPEGYRVVREALQWRGIPRYKMGGCSISRAIDCSNFVEQVFTRAHVPVPDAPVRTQMNCGTVVHSKGGYAEYHGVLYPFPVCPTLKGPQPGDRVIFQSHPEAIGRPGNYHTGIYVGQFKDENGQQFQHAVVHCNSTDKTVSVTELVSHRLWGIYRFTVRGAKPNSVAGVSPSARRGVRIARGGR